jgi:Spy/CpxP family protein refolding chaperone
MNKFTPAVLAALVAGAFFLAGCASQSTASSDPPSKWLAAGNNGGKADRYYQVNPQ